MLNKYYIKLLLFIIIILLISLIIENQEKTLDLPILFNNDHKTYDIEEEYLIYVADKNNLIFPLNIIVRYNNDFKVNYYEDRINNSLDKQIYMTFSLLTNYSNHLPLETKTFVPQTTKLLNYNIDGNVLEMNLSRDFLTYNPQNEIEIIKILTYTFTSIIEIEEIRLYCDNKLIYKKSFSQDDFVLNLFIEDNKSYDLEKYDVYYLTDVNDLFYFVKATIFTSSDVSKAEKINNLLTNVNYKPLHTSVTEENIDNIKNGLNSEENITYYQYYLTCYANNIKERKFNIDIKDINFYISTFP